MNCLAEVEKEYLKLSNNQYGTVVALDSFKFNGWEDFINCNIKFKVEFLTFPSWNKTFKKYVKINEELYSHIKIKSKL